MKVLSIKTTLITTICIFLSYLAAPASALPLNPSDVSATHVASPLITPVVASYDTNTNVFSANTNLGEGTAGFIGTYPVSGTLTDDIIGSFLLEAKVDNTGTVQSGTFAFIGKSDSAGIAPGTALITATVTDIYYDTVNFNFQVRARVDFVSPVLATKVGTVKSLLMYYSVGPGGAFDANPWNASFLESGFTTGPDVFLLDKVLPLTPTEALAEYLVAPSSTPLSSYNANTDRYLMTQSSSLIDQLFLNNYPGFGNLANDFISSMELTAQIDSNGELLNGSQFAWKGESASLSIPSGSTILNGQVVEAIYDGGSQVFQFLVMVTEIHPGLEEEIGPIDTFLVYDFQSPGQAFSDNPWSVSFSDQPYTNGPGLFLTTETLMPSDTDGDGIATVADNCAFVSNGGQQDSDSDGIGSLCDADFNNDCVVNFLDFSLLRENFLQTDDTADMNSDGVVNFLDAALLTQQFFNNYTEENPSAIPNVCN